MDKVVEGHGWTVSRYAVQLQDGYHWLCCSKCAKFHYDMCKWLEFHGFEPIRVPLHSTITRNEKRCYAAATYFAHDENGKIETVPVPHVCLPGGCYFEHGPKWQDLEIVTFTKLEFNEAPPLPFPLFSDNLGRTFEELAQQLNL